jgi:sugar phosphate isomerase/epimerase
MALGALAFTWERGQRPHEGWALHLLGEVNADHRPDRADIYFRDALTHAQQLDMQHLVTHCHLGLGRLHQHTGKPERARAHLTIATAMFREMGLRFWLEKSEAAMS